MSTQRFTEKEIAAIFEEAARAQNEHMEDQEHRDGLTLEELQQIGASTGIAPEFIARAAAALHKKPVSIPVKKHLGIPIAVARTVELPGPFTDEDWERLVVDLRDTFEARGKIRQDGSLRQWTNGNLQALVEPTDDGYRLRLKTRKGSMKTMLYGGFLYMMLGLIMFMAFFVSDNVSAPFSVAFLVSTVFLLMGFAGMASVGISQPRWAHTRERQMDGICVRAAERSGREIASPRMEEEALTASEPLLDIEDPESFQQKVRRSERKRTN